MRARATLLGALLLATPAASAPRPVPGEAAAPRGESLRALAAAVATDVLAAAPEGGLAVHVEGPSAELRRAFTTLLLSELSARGRSALPLAAPTAAEAEAEARARGAHALARLTVTGTDGEVRARGDVLGTWVNFWSGTSPTRPATPAAAVARAVPADEAARLLAASGTAPHAGPLRLEERVLAQLPAPPAALAAGDLDGDGRAEVAVLVDEEVVVLGADGAVRARRSLRALPPSPAPCREPYGQLSIGGAPARLAAFSCRGARGELLALGPEGLSPVATLEAPRAGSGPATLAVALVPGQAALMAEVAVVEGGALTLPQPFVEVSLARAGGGVAGLFLHPDGSGTWLPSLRPGAPAVRVRGLGHGSALADVDGDGTPELVASAEGVRPEPDVLRVAALPGPAAPEAPPGPPLATLPLPRGRVLQLAAADLEGSGAQQLVAGVWLPEGTGELHLVRATRGGQP